MDELEAKSNPKEKTILVVDDDDTILDLFRHALMQEGFNVVAVADGITALNKVKEITVHLIILDLLLPTCDGYEVVRQLQENYDTRSIPVMIITGKKLDEGTKRTLQTERNVVDFIDKPLNIYIVVGKIHKILNTLSSDERIVLDRQKKMADSGNYW